MARLGGNAALFQQMLGLLVREFADLDLRAPTAPGLASRVHKLRGGAGTLGAKAVHHLAGEAEAAIKHDPTSADTAAMLGELARAWATLLAGVRAALDIAPPARAAAPAPQPARSLTTPPADVAAIHRLTDLLIQQDLAALDAFRELAPALRARLASAQLTELTAAIEQLEFARATQLLRLALDARDSHLELALGVR
jgi:HPt (histidine-containing phosphotransfer) domain-containing protein